MSCSARAPAGSAATSSPTNPRTRLLHPDHPRTRDVLTDQWKTYPRFNGMPHPRSLQSPGAHVQRRPSMRTRHSVGSCILWGALGALVVLAATAVGSTSHAASSAVAGTTLIPVNAPPPPRNTDRLYQVLVGEPKDLQAGLSQLLDDLAWKPSEADIAKAVQVLPSLSDENQLYVIWIMHRTPKTSARWIDTLVAYTSAKGFVDSKLRLHIFYFELFAKISTAAPSCSVEEHLEKLWQRRDWAFSKEWVDSAASFRIPGWTDRFREWKKRLPKSFVDANGEFIKDISERADKYDQR